MTQQETTNGTARRTGPQDGPQAPEGIDPALLDAYRLRFPEVDPDDVRLEDRELVGPHGPLRVRFYRPVSQAPNGVGLVWAHGGSWIFGDLDSPEPHDTSIILARAGVTVMSVDYGLAPLSKDGLYGALGLPEHDGVHYPVPTDELTHAFLTAVGEEPELEWFVGGASAGANLAAGTAVALRDADGPQPAGVVLVYPILHADMPELPAEIVDRLVAAAGPGAEETEVIGAQKAAWHSVVENYAGSEAHEAVAFPGGHDVSGLPPHLIINSEDDALRASGQLYAGELAAAGVDVVQVREAGTGHGHLTPVDTEVARRSLERIIAWTTSATLRGEAHERV